MQTPTAGELAFVEFCTMHRIEFERLPTSADPTPDFRVWHDGIPTYFEVKDITFDPAFKPTEGNRTVGDHLRAKIKAANSQMKTAADTGHRSVLLVMNALDGLQIFGTEPTDFAAAMEGEFSVQLSSSGLISGSYHGRNRMFRKDSKTAFSGLGQIYRGRMANNVTIYANRHAKHALVPEGLPKPFTVHFCSPLDAPWVLG